MAYINTVSFPLAADRVTYYSTGANAFYAKLFDTTNNLMVLEVKPRDYTIITRALGNTEVSRGINTVIVPTPTYKTDATVKTASGLPVIGAVINELRQNAIDDGTNQITVWDGCNVEFADQAQGYTIRQWWLPEPATPNAVMAHTGGTDNKSIYGGYTLEFVEL